jgi:hypothetical protein
MSNSTDFTVVDFTKEGLDINNAIQMAIANKQEVKGTSYSLSIQAGENYYSTPQNDIGLYTEVEVGEVDMPLTEDFINNYGECVGEGKYIFPYVPIEELIAQVKNNL